MIEVEVMGRLPSVLTKRQVARAVSSAVAVSRRKAEGAITVAFVTEEAIRKLNRKHRGKDSPTDVLSFASADLRADDGRKALRAGDVFVAPAFVRRDAARIGVEYPRQLGRVVVHGVLHLMGFDHALPAEEKRMFALQEKALKESL